MSVIAPPHYLDPLLQALRSPASAAALTDDAWDRTLRMARAARLLGVLAERVLPLGSHRLPQRVVASLRSAQAEAAFARQMLLHELEQVGQVLEAAAVDFVLLKGAAYVVQRLRCADGRMPADLDLLVPIEQLAGAEHALADAGWAATEMTDYDQSYYRQWAHQVPPLRAAGHVMEVDLHHAILPPLGRHRVNSACLWESATVRLPCGRRALSREDQVVHAVVHLFVDSDCTNRLRDLVDIGALVEQFAADQPRFVESLRARADELGVGVALDDAAVFLSTWLGVVAVAPTAEPAAPLRRAARTLIGRRLAPPDPDAMPPWLDAVGAALLGRSVWLRLPPRLAVQHAATKAARAVGLRRS